MERKIIYHTSRPEGMSLTEYVTYLREIARLDPFRTQTTDQPPTHYVKPKGMSGTQFAAQIRDTERIS